MPILERSARCNRELYIELDENRDTKATEFQEAIVTN
jgi:hypothetical protein